MSQPCAALAPARAPASETPKDKAIKHLALALTRLIIEAIDTGRIPATSRAIRAAYAALRYTQRIHK